MSNTSSCQTDKGLTAAYQDGTKKQVSFADHDMLACKLELLRNQSTFNTRLSPQDMQVFTGKMKA